MYYPAVRMSSRWSHGPSSFNTCVHRWECVQLRSLDLSSNQIVSIPPAIANCAELATLDMHHNALKLLPDTLGQVGGDY